MQPRAFRLVGVLLAVILGAASVATVATVATGSTGTNGSTLPTGRVREQPAPVQPTAVDTACASPGWVAVASMPASDDTGPALAAGSTLREIVYPHLGGGQVRVHLSNAFDANPVVIGSVSIAHTQQGAATDAPVIPLRFAGSPGVTIPPGGEVTSDAATFTVERLHDLSVSIYLPDGAATPAEHLLAMQANYLSPAAAGDQTGNPSGAAFARTPASGDARSPFSSTAILSGVDAYSLLTQGTVVALGDSLTDGLLVTPDASNARWPDVLARRLFTAGVPLSVANAGISGNLVTAQLKGRPYGRSAVDRFATDVAAVAGVRSVILFEGINDLGAGVAAPAVEAGDTSIIAAAHAAGLRILLATLTPSGRAGRVGSTATVTAERLALNAWIRSQRLADGVIDFERAVADPAAPTQLAPAFDGGDHLHLSPAGYARLGEAVPLAALLPPNCISGG